MVRLKQDYRNYLRQQGFEFQSHNGSIKTAEYVISTIMEVIFQSHNGSIKTLAVWVRLYLHLPFQSHNGSIKTSIRFTETWSN